MGFCDALDSDDKSAGQTLGRQFRMAAADGSVYLGVRREAGQCVGLLLPTWRPIRNGEAGPHAAASPKSH